MRARRCDVEYSARKFFRKKLQKCLVYKNKPLHLRHKTKINNHLKHKIMKKYTTRVRIYDSKTRILIDTYELSCVTRCQQINDRRAMSNVKDIYRASRLAELANRYGGVIYRLVDDGLIDPLNIYEFDILK